jgi:hypothetical protein
LPNTVNDVDAPKAIAEKIPPERRVTFVENDAQYRDPASVLTFAQYVLMVFPLLELYDQDRLRTPAEIHANAGFTQVRAQAVMGLLEQLRDLLGRVEIQQGLMAGNGVMSALDAVLKQGPDALTSQPDSARQFSVKDLFQRNPYITKNYAAYLLAKHVGFDRLRHLLQRRDMWLSRQRVMLNGFSLAFSVDDSGDVLFSAEIVGTPAAEQASGAPELSRTPLFTVKLPVKDGTITEEAYAGFIKVAPPPSMVHVKKMRAAVTAKLAELKTITSPALDVSTSRFTRKDLELLVSALRSAK